MDKVNMCPECKVPKLFTREHLWLSNGDIVQSSNHHNRMAFMECENLDPLFANMSDIIGFAVEPLIIDTVQRGTKYYLKSFIPDLVREQVLDGKMDLKTLDDAFRDLAKPLGFGRYEYVDMRFEQDENDYFTVSINEPYSVLITAASHAAAIEAILGYDHGVTFADIGPGTYSITAFPSKHKDEARDKKPWLQYRSQKGDCELERCGTCGGPAVLSSYRWYLDKGIVKNSHTGKRMAIMGGGLLDPLFYELEAELGETINRTVVEAQRRFVKTGFYSIEEVGDEGDIRTQLALRGLGNLKEIKMGKRGVRVRLDNATLYLMVVGLIQGLFEMAFGIDSDVEWVFTGEGNLEVEVTPRVTQVSVDPVSTLTD
jgi:hypothetical protein